VAGIISVILSLFSLKDLAVAAFHQCITCVGDPLLYNYGSKPVQAVWRETVELLIELFGR